MGHPVTRMSLAPYTSTYHRGAFPYGAAPYAAAPFGGYGAYPYGPYGMTAEEIKKVREAERPPSLRLKPSARSSWRPRRRSTRSLWQQRRRSTKTMLPLKRRPWRMPSLRRRSSQRSLDHMPMAHMVLPAHSDMGMGTLGMLVPLVGTV